MESSCDGLLFSTDEIAVAKILVVDLPHVNFNSERQSCSSMVCWGNKRRRSVLPENNDDADDIRRPPVRREALPTDTTSLPVRVQPEENQRCPAPNNQNVETAVAAKAASARGPSPNTPLAFPPSESDERNSSKKRLRAGQQTTSDPAMGTLPPCSSSEVSSQPLDPEKINAREARGKRKREDMLEIIDELSREQEWLKGELLAMKNKHLELSNTNKKLKAKLCAAQQTISVSEQGETSKTAEKTKKKPLLELNGSIDEHFPCQISGNFLDLYGQRTAMGTPPPCNRMGLIDQTCSWEVSSQPLDPRKMLKIIDARKARRERKLKMEAKKQRKRQGPHLEEPP